jgi:predicted esterase YcpF (UPF0227 family)
MGIDNIKQNLADWEDEGAMGKWYTGVMNRLADAWVKDISTCGNEWVVENFLDDINKNIKAISQPDMLHLMEQRLDGITDQLARLRFNEKVEKVLDDYDDHYESGYETEDELLE